MSLDEFSIIRTYFDKKIGRSDVVLGVGDDCAILSPPTSKDLIVTTDTLILNRHFLPETCPVDIGYRAAAVSFSDIAAMAGEPAWLLLALTLPEANEDWLAQFCHGLFSILQQYNVDLVGGNTSKGFLTVTTQVIGFVPKGQAMKRNGAAKGDFIYVTHTLGDAALALAIIKQEIDAALFTDEEQSALNQSLWRPIPRLKEGRAISSLASAAIDVSDGLIADISHILEQSQVGAVLELAQIPISPSLSKVPFQKRYELALSGGDDYELCFTVPLSRLSRLEELNQSLGLPLTCIGEITEQPGLVVKNSMGEAFSIKHQGYSHF